MRCLWRPRGQNLLQAFLAFCSLKWSTHSVKLVLVQSAVCTGRPHWQVLPPGFKGWEGGEIWIRRMRRGSKGLRRLKGLHCLSSSEHGTKTYPFTAKVNPNTNQKINKNTPMVCDINILLLFSSSCLTVDRCLMSLLTTLRKPSAGDLDPSSYITMTILTIFLSKSFKPFKVTSQIMTTAKHPFLIKWAKCSTSQACGLGSNRASQ